jgi:hypothetical protein
MFGKWCKLGLACIVVGTVWGCGPATSTPVKTFTVKMPTGLERAKGLLENYANGSQMSSEATSFSEIVEEVKKTDPQKAQILEDGFADLQKSPQNLRVNAQALLKRL